jgi:hypothetical protein
VSRQIRACDFHRLIALAVGLPATEIPITVRLISLLPEMLPTLTPSGS